MKLASSHRSSATHVHLRAAIATLQAREVEGDLAPAVALAADRLRALGGKKRIIVITDGALAHNEPLAPSGIDTDIVQVGDPVDNAAIVRIDVRTGIDPSTHRDQAQVFAMLENYSGSARDTFVTLSIEGHADPIASRRVLLPPNAKTPVVLSFNPARTDEGAGLTIRISAAAGEQDALAIDDVAFGRVPGGSSRSGRARIQRELVVDRSRSSFRSRRRFAAHSRSPSSPPSTSIPTRSSSSKAHAPTHFPDATCSLPRHRLVVVWEWT